ncbi:MAG: MFS transporter [Alphaproteobacteria bacterium]|nr:MFS transporter [Alphaproteobacteria bacterium]
MTRSLRGLDWLNFFIANFQTGFGPFISVYLTGVGWTQGAIGVALSAGTAAAMASQVPGGALVDATRSKRAATAAAIIAIMASALLIALWPALLPITLAEILHAFASTVLGPAIAALSLALVPPGAFGERLGRNARFLAMGNAFAAGLMGIFGYYISDRAVFLLTAALGLPALAALRMVRNRDLVHAALAATPSTAKPEPAGSLWRVLKDRRLLVYSASVGLFQFGNAAMLPIAAAMVTKRAGGEAQLVIAACIIAPQIITAAISPWAGRAAEEWGRRPILLLGFCALPIRGILFAGIVNPYLIVVIQLLDGLSAGILGVLSPLIVADVARASGRYTTSLGVVGLAIGGGATLSTTVAGLVADSFGVSAAFLSLAAGGIGAAVFVWALLSETKPALDPGIRR